VDKAEAFLFHFLIQFCTMNRFVVFYLTLLLTLLFSNSDAKDKNSILSGPLLGDVEHRSAIIVFELVQVPGKSIEVLVNKSDQGNKEVIAFSQDPDKGKTVFKFELGPLEMNTQFDYQIKVDGQILPNKTTYYHFKTKELWEWRKDAPDFNFVFGSCLYLNDSLYDRPGKPYGAPIKQIANSIAKDTASFMIWTGDNFYFREADYSSLSGLKYRWSHDRATSEIQEMLNIRPNYAIWDDHDYGNNDADASFKFKKESLELFKSYWGNPSYGTESIPGIFTKFSYSDCDFFLLDDRYYRSPEDFIDSINGKPNPEKIYWSKPQIDWLMYGLIQSKAKFKFIVNGNQINNNFIVAGETVAHYNFEYNYLMTALKTNNIKGVVMLSGDRHFTELLKVTNQLNYPLYEYTNSPITSGSFKGILKSKEANNPLRIKGSVYTDQNYGKIKVYGKKGDRQLEINTISPEGKVLFRYVILEKELYINEQTK
jgi:alkaline phosphatase D